MPPTPAPLTIDGWVAVQLLGIILFSFMGKALFDWILIKFGKDDPVTNLKETTAILVQKTNNISDAQSTVCEILDKVATRLEKIEENAQKTWDIHNQYDRDGRPKWFFPSSEMLPKLDMLLQQSTRTNELLVKMVTLIEQQQRNTPS